MAAALMVLSCVAFVGFVCFKLGQKYGGKRS